ncbi:MAG: flagellar basal body P-ring formation protein FlgA [Fibrobacter sp.]|nr:flagellar basal body P-ring formation protein FlgA [Fibrobacter sp.]
MFNVVYNYTICLFITCIISLAGAVQVSFVFRDSVMVNDTLITLGDIAGIRSTDGSLSDVLRNFVVADAAPAGYSRFICRDDLITYKVQSQFKSVQLIARGAVRTCIATNFKELIVGDVYDSIMQYINSIVSWPAGSWNFSVLNTSDKIKIFNMPYRLEFSGINTNRPKGQFSFQMAIIQGGKVMRTPLRCTMKISLPVILAASPIMRGERITPDKCVFKTMDVTHYSVILCDSLSQVVGKRALRQIQEGNVLTTKWLQEIPVVEKGDAIRIISNINKVKVAVDAVARESGAIGEKIWAENAASHKMVRVVIKSKGHAEL